MRPGGVQAENAAVNHVREPRQRMPVARGHRGERPFHARPRHTVLHDGLVGDVKAVVIDAKAEPRHRQIEREGGDGEQQSDTARQRHGILVSDFGGGAKRDSIIHAKSFCNFRRWQ